MQNILLKRFPYVSSYIRAPLVSLQIFRSQDYYYGSLRNSH